LSGLKAVILAGAGLIAWDAMGSAQASSIHRCRDAEGHVAFQDFACAEMQEEERVEIAAAPPPAPSPVYGHPPHEHAPERARRVAGRSRPAASRAPVSYECRAGDGEVFYRHSPCPKSIRIRTAASGGRGQRAERTESVPVAGTPLSRSEACRRLAASAARSGRERDDQVSTYEHNIGRDPCRRS
jgi:hypothetical protein